MNRVLVVGSGTIGLPLIHLFTRFKREFGLDEVMFHKNTPLKNDITSVKQLTNLGAKLATDENKFDGFRALGVSPSYTRVEAIERATGVVDCTPSGYGMENKNKYYDQHKERVKRFIFQGSEDGAGVKFATGITQLNKDDQFVQVVSCNTHNIAALLMTFEDPYAGDFVCMRRANDISQDDDFIPSPTAEKIKDKTFGSHHAADAYDLLKDILPNTKLYSTALKLNTQYMHTIRFSIYTKEKYSLPEVIERFNNTPYIALTEKTSTNKVFSFGREHGFFGRILNQAVICTPTLDVKDEKDGSIIRGISFTPQDGNSLISTVYATLQAIHPNSVDEKMKYLEPYIFSDI